jgi:2-hydroxy-6-oxonona-2,4-dienedioate hydrolase/2-succinyl-6-hydroxy-2,4-cyclohexadiene-1-carboxylate synthase
MAKALANGIELHCQQFGKGPDIVMVHGITGNLAIWHLEIVPDLMQEYRVTTYDLRGHGYSDVPPTGYTTADHATDLKHLLDALGIQRAHVMGHSFGADIALHFTVLFPERVNRLMLVEPAIAALLPLRQREDWIGWKYWRDKLALGGVTVPPEKWYDNEYLVRASVGLPMLFGFRKGRARRAAPLVRLMDTTTAAKDYCEVAGMTLDKIDQIRHRTLVLYGEDSVFVGTYEYLRDHLVHSTCVLMPDSEHFGPIERPQLLLQRVREFLRESETISDGGAESSSEPGLKAACGRVFGMNLDLGEEG